MERVADECRQALLHQAPLQDDFELRQARRRSSSSTFRSGMPGKARPTTVDKSAPAAIARTSLSSQTPVAERQGIVDDLFF